MSSPRPGLRVVFAGTPDFAATALAALHAAGFTIPLVLTQPDRPAGRHLKLMASPVKRFALEHGIKVLQPLSLRSAAPQYSSQLTQADPVKTHSDSASTAGEFEHASEYLSEGVHTTEYALEQLRACACDVMVVAAYGLLLPQSVLDIPRYGCINLHASLLPRWRGAAPIQRAIEAGDKQTGITIMQMEAGLDTGPMISTTPIPIHATDNAASLHDKLAFCAAEQIVLTLHQLACDGQLAMTPQPTEGISYASKISVQDRLLDWHRPAPILVNQIRAFDPHPGCQTVFEETGVTLKISQAFAAPALPPSEAQIDPQAPLPGTVLQVALEGVWVACGTGVLCITVCQKPGGKKLPMREFLSGFPISVGQRFILPS